MMKKFTPFIYLVISVGLLLTIQFYPQLYERKYYNQASFQKTLHQKEKLAKSGFESLLNTSIGNLKTGDFSKQSEQNIDYFVFRKNQPIFWTDGTIPLNISDLSSSGNMIKLKTGWYQYFVEQKKELTFLSLILVKNAFELENKYLKPTFEKAFNLPPSIGITYNQESGYPIYDINGAFLFSIEDASENHTSSNWLSILGFIIAVLLMFRLIYLFLKGISRIKKFAPLITILVIVVTYFGCTFNEFPSSLYFQKVFSPTIFAQSQILPSLGSLIFATVCLFAIILLLVQQIRLGKKNLLNKFTFIVICSLLAILISNWLVGLINNSNIFFDINSLAELTTYSFIGIIIILTLFVSVIVLTQAVFNKFREGYSLELFLAFSVTFSSLLIGLALTFDLDWFLSLWFIGVLVILHYSTYEKAKFYSIIGLLVVVGFWTSFGFIKYNTQKNLLKNESLIKKLAIEKDPVTEYLFQSVENKILSDSSIINNVDIYWEKKDSLDQYIKGKYFKGFWSKYDVSTYLCEQNDSLIVENNQEVSCIDFFNDKLKLELDDPLNDDKHIAFLYSNEGVSSYLANIKLNEKTKLFIELSPKLISNIEGYPELLLNAKDIDISLNLNKNSFAKYKNGKLTTHLGEMTYSSLLKNDLVFDEDGFYREHEGEHLNLYYKSDKNTVVVLTSKSKSWVNYLTSFSYFFILAGILIIIIGLCFRLDPFNWSLAITDFSTKIQLFIIAFTFFSFIVLGWGTSYYLKKQYNAKTVKTLKEKVHSVLIEIQNVLGSDNQFSPEFLEFLDYELVNLSNIFYSDINLYDTNGLLLNTSRPEMLERGLITNRMNPEAATKLIKEKKSGWIADESIHTLNYLSAYIPLRNVNNEVIAFLNLPYFAKQNQLENELSNFFTALINIYAFLFLLSTIIAIVFAKYISQPVRLIKEKMSALQIGKMNDLIEWQSNDEIGALVQEYNKKVIELEKSASLLAKSERESAWREMAKQVAHEIKNPLTPMKLSIQHLQRTINDNPEDLNERIKRTSTTLIEQIDSLTNIANEFSNFAKMPQAQEQQIELGSIIRSNIDLYADENNQIIFDNKIEGAIEIVSDKDQMSRVFSNLIKNAIQAIPEERSGDIVITAAIMGDKYQITIADNGQGIDEDKVDKIFQPNFTTKTTGMGLGLAMVKNIIENSGGEISFTTEKNIGTTFTLLLPKV